MTKLAVTPAWSHTIVGIDPGITGALSCMRAGLGTPILIDVRDMPTMPRGPTAKKDEINAAELARMLKGWKPAVVFVELVNAMPTKKKDPVTGKTIERPMPPASAFNFGDTFGVVKGVVGALGIPIDFLTPRDWKSLVGLQPGSKKDAARTRAQRWYPEAPLGTRKDVGRAEAILIARAGCIVHKGTVAGARAR